MRADHAMETYLRWPVEFVSGQGAILEDTNGREYIDMVAGIAVAGVGHAHPTVAQAISDQARLLLHVSNLYVTGPGFDLAERLHNLTGMRPFFCNSGAEAIECAIKLARKWGTVNKPGVTPRIVCTEDAFHGRTLGSLTATGQPGKKTAFEPLLEGFTHVPFGDEDALAAAMGDDVVAVLLEPIQGEAGVIVPPSTYLPKAKQLCKDWNALLMLDEVQTGLGRTGAWFAHEHAGVTPDVMCLAKALGSGLPIGACLARDEVASVFVPGDHGSTFGAGPVQSAAALATLDVIETEGLVERADVTGKILMSLLADAFGEGAVRGKGLLVAVQLQEPTARKVVERALEGGVLVNDAAPDILRFVPPLCITEEQVERGVSVVAAAWAEGATS
jgi:acetylornithine/N-succinyldiaminopimelate aminotransferase